MPYESVQMDSANTVSNTVSRVPSKKQGEAHPINQQATVSQLDSRFQVSSNGFSTSRIRSSSQFWFFNFLILTLQLLLWLFICLLVILYFI